MTQVLQQPGETEDPNHSAKMTMKTGKLNTMLCTLKKKKEYTKPMQIKIKPV